MPPEKYSHGTEYGVKRPDAANSLFLSRRIIEINGCSVRDSLIILHYLKSKRCTDVKAVCKNKDTIKVKKKP